MQAKWDEMFGVKEEPVVEEVKVKKPRKKAAIKKKVEGEKKPVLKKTKTTEKKPITRKKTPDSTR
jgi:hypothetical protein